MLVNFRPWPAARGKWRLKKNSSSNNCPFKKELRLVMNYCHMHVLVYTYTLYTLQLQATPLACGSQQSELIFSLIHQEIKDKFVKC